MRALALLVRQVRYEQKLYWRSPSSAMFTFLFPILLKDIGTDLLLLILVGTSLVGALVTWRYAIETKGINLEDIDEKERAANGAGGAP